RTRPPTPGRRPTRPARVVRTPKSPLAVVDEDQGSCTPTYDTERPFERDGVEGRQAFVEDEQVGALEDGAGDEQPAALPLTELPAGLPDHLEQPAGHPVEQFAESEVAAQGVGLGEVVRRRRPAPAQEEVVRQRA